MIYKNKLLSSGHSPGLVYWYLLAVVPSLNLIKGLTHNHCPETSKIDSCLSASVFLYPVDTEYIPFVTWPPLKNNSDLTYVHKDSKVLQ